MKKSRLVPLFLVGGLLSLLGAGCGGQQDSGGGGGGSGQKGSGLSGSISGAGSSAQAAAQEAWTAGFQQANPGATISYDPVGSGGGREQFIAGGTTFGGTDAALDSKELKGAKKRCGGPDNFIEVPVYISPIAVVYNLEGVDNLQLSPKTAASIFKGDITQWNDPAIAKENPGVQLPGTRITPVHRSDESGTTENFTDYLSQTSPDVWTAEVSGDWPEKGGEAAQGTSGVVRAVKNGSGTIGYADASQAKDLGVAKIQVGQEYVAPSPEAAAAILDKSKETDDEGKYVFSYELDRTLKEPGLYPISLVSYGIACTKYDKPKDGEIAKGYLQYIISKEGQQTAGDAAGSAPISDALRSKIQPAVDAIGGGK